MSKTYTGGYRLVSLAFIDLALAYTAIAVAGLGDALGVKSRKRVVLTDIVVSGEKKNDLSVQVKKDGNNYVIEDVYGYDLSIDASGNVTSSEHSSGGSGGTKLYLHDIYINRTKHIFVYTTHDVPAITINDAPTVLSALVTNSLASKWSGNNGIFMGATFAGSPPSSMDNETLTFRSVSATEFASEEILIQELIDTVTEL